MVAVGVSYLVFEHKLLSKSKFAADSTAPAHNTLSRGLIGIQVSYSDVNQPMTWF